jgi:hypothetical protein
MPTSIPGIEVAKNSPSHRTEPWLKAASADRSDRPEWEARGERRKNVTAQPRPAGWYPDPTGQGGQKYWDGGKWEQDVAAASRPGHVVLADCVAQKPPVDTHLYKNPVRYALGGLILPPLVLFLMGGDRTTCAWMLGLWVLFWITVWMLGLGAIFAIALYIWSVVACYREAVEQNMARGLA